MDLADFEVTNKEYKAQQCEVSMQARLSAETFPPVSKVNHFFKKWQLFDYYLQFIG